MHCPFCKKVSYPTNGSGGGFFNLTSTHSGASNSSWMCFHCPNVVKFTTPDNNYSIVCFSNGHWYEVTWLRDSKKYVIHQYTTELAVNAENASEYWAYDRKLVLTLDSEENITPENIKKKLTTILVFS